MPPRTTRKSNRPRVADRTMVDTVQPQGLQVSETEWRRRDQNGTAEMEQPNQVRGAQHPNQASLITDRAGCREPYPRLRRREKNVLDIPSYRTGDYTKNPSPRRQGLQRS